MSVAGSGPRWPRHPATPHDILVALPTSHGNGHRRVDGTVTQGIVYIATGPKYIRAAVHSATTVRHYCPGLPTHLFADWRSHGFDFGTSPAPFASVEEIDRPHRRSKVDYLARTPFDRTLYLDGSTADRIDGQPTDLGDCCVGAELRDESDLVFLILACLLNAPNPSKHRASLQQGENQSSACGD